MHISAPHWTWCQPFPYFNDTKCTSLWISCFLCTFTTIISILIIPNLKYLPIFATFLQPSLTRVSFISEPYNFYGIIFSPNRFYIFIKIHTLWKYCLNNNLLAKFFAKFHSKITICFGSTFLNVGPLYVTKMIKKLRG